MKIKWIRYKQRRPKESGFYLTYSPTMTMPMMIISYYVNKVLNSGWDSRNGEITHWAYCPKAPNKKWMAQYKIKKITYRQCLYYSFEVCPYRQIIGVKCKRKCINFTTNSPYSNREDQ
jgi:hypothetical protein